MNDEVKKKDSAKLVAKSAVKEATDNKVDDKNHGREEIVIKYGFIALGVILAIAIIAFAVVSIVPRNALSVGKYKISEKEFGYHYYDQKNILYQSILEYYPDVTEAEFLQAEYDTGLTYHEFAKQLALERIADIYIMLDLADKDGYVYDEKELEDSRNNFIATFKDYSDRIERKVDDVAKEIYGCDFDTVIEVYDKTWISSKYQDDLLLSYEAMVTEDTMVEYYENFKDDLDTVTLRQLFIATYDTEAQEYYDEAGYNDSKARIEALLERVNNGETLAELVVEFSEDPAVIETMGEYTAKKADIGLETLATWAFTSEVGTIEIVETEIGFHLVELIDRTEYEEVKDSVRSNIAYGEFVQMTEKMKLLDEYKIGYYEAFARY